MWGSSFLWSIKCQHCRDKTKRRERDQTWVAGTVNKLNNEMWSRSHPPPLSDITHPMPGVDWCSHWGGGWHMPASHWSHSVTSALWLAVTDPGVLSTWAGPHYWFSFNGAPPPSLAAAWTGGGVITAAANKERDAVRVCCDPPAQE